MKEIEIEYRVFKYSSPRRPFWVIRYHHPVLGAGEKSTKQVDQIEAEKFAVRWIAELQSDQCLGSRVTWKGFRKRFEGERLPGIPSQAGYRSALNAFEQRCDPGYLDQITAATLATFRDKLLSDGKAEATAANYLKHLMAVLSWGEGRGLIAKAPTIKPGSTKRMRGRPVTVEEFERMLKACRKVVGPENAKALQRVLKACWTVGLRRSEVFELSWDDPTRIHLKDIDSRMPKIIFPHWAHKGRRDLTLPLLPEAVELFRTWSTRQRKGFVLLPLADQRGAIRTPDQLGKLVAQVGKKAKVVTHRTFEGEARHATLHDLRRSFGTRLAENPSIPIAFVAQLMRHKSFETTMDHYVQANAERLGSEVWNALGCTPACTNRATRSSERAVSQVVKEL